MEPGQFDALTRAFLSGTNRRTVLAAALGALAPILGAAKPKSGSTLADERCIANGQRCGKGSGKHGKKDVPCARCCSKYGTPKSQGPQRCNCKPEGAIAGNAAQCCSGQRSADGHCGACNPGLHACPPDGCIDLQANNGNCGACGNACDSGQTCVAGQCTCTASSCSSGCCAGDQCKPGTSDDACGGNGGACITCSGTGVTCGGGGSARVCGCTPDADSVTCAGVCGIVQNNCGQDVNCTAHCAGCCDGATCRNGESDANCGTAGAACKACGDEETCDTGVCRPLTCGESGGSCLVFVTSTVHDGNLGGLTGADKICQDLAEAAGLPGTYAAWLSTTTSSPSTRFTRNDGPYRLVDGTTIANNWDDLTDGALAAPIDLDESGNMVSNYSWTATSADGTLFTYQYIGTCTDWMSNAEYSTGGKTTETDDGWTVYAGGLRCNANALPLYCFQQGS